MWQVGSSLDKSTEYIPKRSIEKVQEKGCFVAKSSIYVQDVWGGQENVPMEVNLCTVCFIREMTH